MTRSEEYRGWIIATVAGAFAIPGLFDTLVKFDTWFQDGVLFHWNNLKTHVLALLPIAIPDWYIDGFVMIGIYARAVAQAVRQSALFVFSISMLIPVALVLIDLIASSSVPPAFYYTIGGGALVLSAFWAFSKGFIRFIISLALTSSLGIVLVLACSDALQRL